MKYHCVPYRFGSKPKKGKDGRSRRTKLPRCGTKLTGTFKGREYTVFVRKGGIEYDGKLYLSLTTVTTQIAGRGTNGPVFFGLHKRGDRPKVKRISKAARERNKISSALTLTRAAITLDDTDTNRTARKVGKRKSS